MGVEPHENTLTGVLVSSLEDYWPDAWELLKEAVEYSRDRLTGKMIVDALLEKEMQLWIIPQEEGIKAAVLTEILTYTTGLKVVRILACGGKDLKDWMDNTVETLAKWGRNLGCTGLELYGRPGWERKLKGWGKPFICLEKDITGGDNEQR